MVAVTLDSGRVDNLASTDRVVFSELVDLGPDVPWVRVIFSDASLPPGSAVRVTSLFDGESQTLDADELARWYNGTAFFNGSSVQVELIAGPRTTGNSIRIAEVYAGDMIAREGGGDVGEVAAICGTTDDRTQVPIGEKLAVGRLLPGEKSAPESGGCTAFIIDSPPGDPNKLHLTAGHCFGHVDQDLKEPWILQFDVPKSNADCTLNHPLISHQWIVNGAEVISREDVNAIGNDYAIFGCYPHQLDKLTTFERQGAAYALASTTPETANVQVAGYGTDGGVSPNACAPCQDGNLDAPNNQVLQTDKGAAKVVSANGKPAIAHDADTCGGNSGSPIVDQDTGLVIGIHTNAGCKGDAAQNFGTRIDNPMLQLYLQREKDKIVRDLGSECAPGQLPPCDDVTLSFGTFQILVDEVYRDWMAGYPGYDDHTKILTSPRLFDPGTVIGRSAPHLDGDPTSDLGGTVVGKKGTVISDGTFTYVPSDKDQEGFEEGPPLITREVHTELVSLDLCDTPGCDPNGYDCACVLAGQSGKQKVLLISPGEVESKSSRANPLEDFPAESFFNIFAEVWIPQGGSAPFDGAVVHNLVDDPLLITNNQLADLPPSVIYRHGNARAVPVYFNTDPPKGVIGDEFGRLILAGHGVAMEETDFDTESIWIVPMCVEPNSLGCWSGCLLCENDPGCDTALDPVPTDLVREELNFSPVDLALIAPPEVNRFSEAVRDVLAKQTPAPQIVDVANIQDAIAAIQAKPGRHTVIFAHGSAGQFRIGPDDLADPAVQDKFIAGAKGQIKELALFGCEVGLDQAFLKKLTDGLQLPIHTWEGKVYAFGHDPVIPVDLQNGFFIEVGTDKKQIPAVTPLGLVVMVILVLAAGAVVIKRARIQRLQA